MINFKKLLECYKKESLETLLDLLRIDSVYDESSLSPSTPYGKGVDDALNFMYEVALKKGFNAKIYGNRVLEITYGTKGKEVGVFGHLDVVPTTSNWSNPPFSPIIKDERIYARGSSDDKGPVVAAFYSLLALKENNLIDDYRVRLVSGGDEERGSSCLDYYFNVLKRSHVDIGFTPDGNFPLIHGEKGITNYKLIKHIELDNLKFIKGGLASNSVIDDCYCSFKDNTAFIEYLNSMHASFKLIKDEIHIIGKSAHGSTPEKGFNSGILLLKYIGDFLNNKELIKLAHSYDDFNGKNLNCYYISEAMGETTFNVGLIEYKEGVLKLTVNFRYPENVNIDEAIKTIKKESKESIIEVESTSPVLYFEKDSFIVKTLLKAYQEETKDYVTPIMTIGGGTYAKEAKNIIAFGSAFPSKDDHIHEVDEKIDLCDFYDSMPIYMHAIYELGKKNEN